MSTILDALKKSEQERRLNQVPTLSDMPAPHESSKWPIILMAAVFLVLLILLALVVKKIWFSPTQSQVLPVRHEAPVTLNSAPPVDAVPVANNESVEINGVNSSLAVNVVSYSKDPTKRFIMIDGNLLREGEFVTAGVKVEEIRQNEVVFNSRGEKIIRRP